MTFRFPKAWLSTNILVNSGWLLLMILSDSLLAIYGASLLVVVALVVDSVVTVLEYRACKL